MGALATLNLADIIAANAASAPDKAAVRFNGSVLTYRALTDRIDRTASYLAAEFGIGRGDRLAVLALNHPDTLVLLYACARLGAMLAPLNWRLAAPELAYILGHAEPKSLFVGDDFAALADRLGEGRGGMGVVGLGSGSSMEPHLDDLLDDAGRVARSVGSLSDPLLLIYTSGTTGRPKGAVLRQDALVWNAAMSVHMHDLTSADHALAVLPFFHVGGLNIQTIPTLHAGGTVTIHHRFAPDSTIRAIGEDRPSLTVLVPATIAAVIADPAFAGADLSSLRAVATGSTYVPQPLVDALEGRGVPVLQVYGSTETCPISIYTRIGGERTRPGSTGWPGPYCEAMVVDGAGRELPAGAAGEVWVRGRQVFSGYWRDERATADALVDGWFRTGDIATRAPDGALTVHDRKKNVIISGGENIYPAEVERVLLAHAAVAEAAVVGRPDPRWGETPVAHVVLRPGHACTADALAAHLAAELARFKHPRHYVFAEELPKSALGKVQHHLLKERAT
jgi:fatty-acyl-CoA synthase